MKKHLIFLILASMALISCQQNTKKISNTPLSIAADSANIKYQCPMKCESDTAYTAPGQCPVCEMDLQNL
ncbi:MAG: Heavy metal binding domain [Bacteroidota bacterium]|jgi:nitrous oxide reductase accessory protein NosL